MIRLLVLGIFFSIIGACNSSKKSGNTIKVIPDNAAIDSIDYFSKDYTVTHVANAKRIEGGWNVSVMYRVTNSAEKLTGVTLDFTSNGFSGKAPCNRVSGNYKIEDFKISFSNVAATKMVCSKLETESAFLKLLETAVDNFTFRDNKLLLKNNKNEVVFECVKTQ
jgi:heat shock protein HslJ